MEVVGPGNAEEPSEETNSSEGLNCAPATAAVVAVDERRRITTFSPEAESMFRLPASHLLHQPLTRLPLPLQEAIGETFASGQAVRNREVNLPGDGQRCMLRISTTPVRNGGEQIQGVIAVLDDITCVSKLSGKMRQLDRLASIGTLSASMAHEIKNAMVPVRIFVDLLIQKNKDAELGDLVVREMRRVESILSQMLKFAGPAKPTFAPMGIHPVLEQALQLIEHQMEGKKLTLRRAFHASPGIVRGDAYQLEQAFLNLFFNAMDAMGPNGCLSISTEIVPPAAGELREAGISGGAGLKVGITDTGSGVMPEHVDRLFEPFFTTKPEGTGLGLTITRRIVHEHQGTIHVETRLNHGTTFSILLPVETGADGAPGIAG